MTDATMERLKSKYPAADTAEMAEAAHIADTPSEYVDYPVVAELWAHLKRYGRACGIRLRMDEEEISLAFNPPLGPPAPHGKESGNRHLVGMEALRLFRACHGDLRVIVRARMEGVS